MDDQPATPTHRPSTTALLVAAALGAAVLGLGGAAWAQSAEPTAPGVVVTQDEECEEDAGAEQAPAPGASSSAT